MKQCQSFFKTNLKYQLPQSRNMISFDSIFTLVWNKSMRYSNLCPTFPSLQHIFKAIIVSITFIWEIVVPKCLQLNIHFMFWSTSHFRFYNINWFHLSFHWIFKSLFSTYIVLSQDDWYPIVLINIKYGSDWCPPILKMNKLETLGVYKINKSDIIS